MPDLPTLDQIRATAARIEPHILRTPIMPCYGARLEQQLPASAELWLKLELLQRTGSFKPRGALNVMLQLDDEQRRRGVTAFSAGNHAIATAYAARILGLSAKVAMPTTANTYRVERCRAYGAEIIFADTIGELLGIVQSLESDEGRTLVHPYEGIYTTLGTATLGLELCEDAPPPDVVVVPVGGGGLISGIASAVRACYPGCKIVGVEPEGASGMRDSLLQGTPMEQVPINTIADSLGAPMHAGYSFGIVQQTVDEIVTVSDKALKDMMRLMFGDLKFAVEPACAAALAAIVGPLKPHLAGQRIIAVLCGSNIDQQTYTQLTVTDA